MTSRMVANKEKLINLQKELLQRFRKVKKTEARREYVILYETSGEIWYRIRQQKDKIGDNRKQICCPSRWEKMMEAAHDSLLGGRLRV